MYGPQLLEDFIREKVDVSQIQIEKNSSSGLCLIPIDKNGNRQIFSFRGANAQLKPADINTTYLTQAALVHITSPPLDVTKLVARTAHKNKVLVSYDPGGKVLKNGLAYIEPVLEHTDIFLLSQSELASLFPNLKNPPDAVNQLLDNYAIPIVVTKLGAQGCLIITKNEQIRVEGFKVDVIDTTGAGDAFAAAFTVGIHNGWDLKKCALYANAAGALKITRMGARTALPTLEELETFLRERKLLDQK